MRDRVLKGKTMDFGNIQAVLPVGKAKKSEAIASQEEAWDEVMGCWVVEVNYIKNCCCFDS